MGMNTDELDAKIDSIQSMARNELKEKKFLYVSKELTGYYNNKELCGLLVAEEISASRCQT